MAERRARIERYPTNDLGGSRAVGEAKPIACLRSGGESRSLTDKPDRYGPCKTITSVREQYDGWILG